MMGKMPSRRSKKEQLFTRIPRCVSPFSFACGVNKTPQSAAVDFWRLVNKQDNLNSKVFEQYSKTQRCEDGPSLCTNLPNKRNPPKSSWLRLRLVFSVILPLW